MAETVDVSDRNGVVPVHRIGVAARLSGVSAANIRYYEKEGLLAPSARGDNSYRLYSDAEVHRLRFVRLCRAMDMSLDEVRTLLALDWSRKADCDAARVALDAHLGHVRERLQELLVLEADLEALRGRCDGSDDHCHLIEALHARADAQPAQAAAANASLASPASTVAPAGAARTGAGKRHV